MTDLEMNSLADGLITFLTRNTEQPIDGLSVLGIAVIKMHDLYTDGETSFEKFVESFTRGLLESKKDRVNTNPGTGMVQ